MVKVSRKDTKPEIAVRKTLFAFGLRYRKETSHTLESLT